MRVVGSRPWIPAVSTLDIPGSARWPTAATTWSEPTVALRSHIYGTPAAISRVDVVQVAWLQVARIVADTDRVVYRPSAGLPSAAITLQITGASIIEQYGRTARLVAGDWSICDSSEPYTLTGPFASERLVILIPGVRIERGIDLRAVTARVFSSTSGVSRLAFVAANWLMEEFSSLTMVRADDLADSLSRLMNLAIYEGTRQHPVVPVQRTLRDRIREYIGQHLHDPELSLDTIARDLNASKRSLHRALREIDGSIHNLIWHARLERCREDLRDPTKSQQSIANIAQSWGFKNSTHFSRAFRTRYGMSAREVRRGALGHTA
jgi:AraC-like DNA-binding protein